MEPAKARSDRALIGIGIAVAVVVVAAIVAVLVRPAAEPLDPTTPEGVIQGYSEAVLDGDTRAALDFLVPEIADDCQRVENYGFGDADVRVVLVSSTEDGSTADVRVSIVTTYGGGLFGPDEYRTDGRFDLQRVDGEWRIESAPWELAVCTPGDVG
ncbi:hypothetical protein [Agromyces mangrovi Wang et al. 2018]|uniref:hypothetical protein n=1 Tax=Agromyces mangrovi TaxID=1858653 RepID=UPI00257329C4|nr:hypothetical protein [Agromyces mangrovi]BDZ63112.1 hypothetical protein GCM10025877_00500 [Agromyces mangrovi]